MNNIESITNKIAADAKALSEQKLLEAQQEAQEILKDYQAQAEQVKTQAQAKAQKEAAAIAERVDSQSALVRRNLMLQYKRQAIEQAFDKALEQLCSIPKDKQIALLSTAAAKYVSSDAQIILNKEDSAAFGNELIAKITEKLHENNKNYTVTLAQPGSMKGGMIVAEDKIETNLTYEILVQNMRDELEGEVAKILTE